MHTIHAGALENYTKVTNYITKLLTELSWAIEVMDKNNECNYYLYYYYNIKVNKVLAL